MSLDAPSSRTEEEPRRLPSNAVNVRTPVPRDVWEELFAADRHALAEHGPRWVEAICATGPWRDASRLYELGDGRRFVLPLVRKVGAAGAGGWYASPPAAWGMGGLVGPDQDGAAVHAVVRDLRGLGAVRISIRPNPLTAPMWADVQGSGITAIPRYGHVLDLSGGLEAVEGLRNKSTRRGLRRAAKEGVQVELDHTGALLPVHYQLYLNAVRHWSDRQREPLALALFRAKRRDPLEKLQAMAKHLGEDFCHFVAYHDGRPVASSIMLIGPAAHDTRAAMDRELAGPVRANDLLQARSIEHALERGCTEYHLGESGANEQLAAFKERFGAVGHHYAEYRIERLPVTRVDSAARGTVKRLIGFKDA